MQDFPDQVRHTAPFPLGLGAQDLVLPVFENELRTMHDDILHHTPNEIHNRE
jgi:hypothetical protein